MGFETFKNEKKYEGTGKNDEVTQTALDAIKRFQKRHNM